MRVLEAFGEPISFGGQESFVINVLKSMDRTDISADLLSPYYCDNRGLKEDVRQWGGEVYTLGCDFRPGKLRNNTVAPIKRFLNEHSYDVIHIHSGSNSMLAIFSGLAADAGIPKIIVHSHCTGKHGARHFFSKAMTSHTLKKYPSAFCSCSREAGEWRFPGKICREKLNIINNGIDTDKFRYNEEVRKKIRSELGIDDNTILIGCVGRLTYQKNQSFLIDVLHKVITGCTGENDYKLILIGDGEDRGLLERKAENSGLNDYIIFTGAVDNVQDYLQAIDVAAMPSRYEGLAIAVIEEQAAGLEIIASDAIPESAAVTENVRFLPSDDKEKWADEIMRDHFRHPEQTSQVIDHGYSIYDTAAAVRRLYLE